MTVAELSTLLSVVCMLLIGLLTFLGRNVLSDMKDLQGKVTSQDKALAVIDAGKLGARVEKLEADMSEIKGDLRFIRAWVENQNQRAHMHRRAGDTPLPREEG